MTSLKVNLLFFFSFISLLIRAQEHPTTLKVEKPNEVFIEMTHMNTVSYLGVSNNLTIHSNKYSSSQLLVETNNGEIVSIGGFNYRHIPDSVPTATITVSLRVSDSKTKILSKKMLRIKRIPNPTASIGGKTSWDSKIDASELKNSQGIRSIMTGFDFDLSLQVSSFKLAIITIKNEYIDLGGSDDNRFTGAMKNQLKRDDLKQVIISEINATMPDGQRNLSPMVLDVIYK